MSIQHAAIPDAQLHEPKGVVSAAANKIYVANGTGSGTWKKIAPTQLEGITTAGTLGQHLESDGVGGFLFNQMAHGAIYFNSYATPSTIDIVTQDIYTKVTPTTTALGDSTDITEATTARLTYTGTVPRHLRVLASLSLDQVSGGTRVVSAAVFKNGVILQQSAIYISTTSSSIINASIIVDTVSTNTNDYFEVYIKNITGVEDIRVYNLYLTAFSLG